MRWSKKNKGLIKQLVDRYHWMFEKKSRTREFMEECPFCSFYYDPVHHCDDGCPNVIITNILNFYNKKDKLKLNCFKHEHYIKLDCFMNACYIGLKFRNERPCKTPSNIKKRLRFWQDAFELTKKEFIKKYKKKGKTNEN